MHIPTDRVLCATMRLALPLLLAACTQGPAAAEAGTIAPALTPRAAPSPPRGAAPATAPPGRRAALPLAVVHKSPTCGCCGAWIDHLRKHGFRVEVREEVDLGPTKARLGVPAGKASCHTAEIGGYLVEGHVPAADIERLLRERPRARGLVLPGMPVGSPGMEVEGVAAQPYTVELVTEAGDTLPYAHHPVGEAP